jgi:hypothetical protein
MGLPASDLNTESLNMKRGRRGTHQEARRGGRGAGRGDRRQAVELRLRAAAARARGEGGEMVWEEARLEGALYRVERGAEGRARRWCGRNGRRPLMAAAEARWRHGGGVSGKGDDAVSAAARVVEPLLGKWRSGRGRGGRDWRRWTAAHLGKKGRGGAGGR